MYSKFYEPAEVKSFILGLSYFLYVVVKAAKLFNLKLTKAAKLLIKEDYSCQA